MPLDAADYISMFDDETLELPLSVDGTGVDGDKNGDAGPPALLAEDIDWQNDPVSVKLEKIRGVFLNAKTASEVSVAASMMQIGDWLEYVGKLSKQVDTAPVQITAIRIELPPREDYSGDVVEVELAQ